MMITVPEIPLAGQSRCATLRVAPGSTKRRPNTLRAIIWLWMQRHEQRRKLARLPDHLLSDVGMSRETALAEACKWFWQD